ncbi:MAG: polymer-forming cytoskeletal protein [Inquilinus sp.]|nr:polymer-forming cytoskeletal protein [Inquilinus sp.]
MIFQNDKTSSARPEGSGRSVDPGKKKVQHSIISADLKITGDLESTGDITVDGTVEGNIKCRTLILGEEPEIKSSIEADTVRICGAFSGDVKARKVVLTKTARVTGDIFHECLEVEEGASLEGRLGRLGPGKANGKHEDDGKVTAFKPVEAGTGSD